jgi:lysophospholipase L1-like esterase
MQGLTIWLFLCCMAGAVQAQDGAPVRLILVGDSTMASRTGYGDALCARLRADVTCINMARGGRSSASYRAEGLWDQVSDLLRDRASYRATYVLIQFGHNDQPGKPGRSTDLVNEFPANMTRYAADVGALGAIPLLVTPLTRRSFRGRYLHGDLAPWSAATRRVARGVNVDLLDLHALSAAAVQAMGQQQADTLAQVPDQATPAAKFDYTHLGAKGADLFSAMAADELVRLRPELAAMPRSR